MVTRNAPPKWASKILSAEDAANCAKAIAVAEQKTTGEIVVAIARRSTPVRHIIVIISLLFLSFGFLWQIFGFHEIGLGFEFIAIPMAALLSQFPVVQRIFSFEADLEEAVHTKARAAFYEAGVERTAGATGILIYISLMEHRIIVLGDRAIDDKLPNKAENEAGNQWTAIVSKVLSGLHKGSLADGLQTAIAEAGVLLMTHFPAQEMNLNEIKDHLVYID